MEAETLTKAQLSKHVSAFAVESARMAASLAEGMWNPKFCSSDGTVEARQFIATMRAKLDWLEERAPPPS